MNLHLFVLVLALISSSAFAQEPTKDNGEKAKEYLVWVYKWVDKRWEKQSEHRFTDNRKAHEYVEQVKAFSENWTATTNAPPTPEQEAATDAKKMVGVWFFVFKDKDGNDVIPDDSMFFLGTETGAFAFFTLTTQNGMAFKLNAAHSPRWIDFERALFRDKQKGIYEFIGDERLRLCMSKWEKEGDKVERPTEFKHDRSNTLFELKRRFKNLEELQAARDKAREQRLKSLVEEYREREKRKEKSN